MRLISSFLHVHGEHLGNSFEFKVSRCFGFFMGVVYWIKIGQLLRIITETKNVVSSVFLLQVHSKLFFFPQILEKSLRCLFETRDLSLVKKYVQRQCTKLMEGRASLQDFTFAKEYRGMKNYKPGACVPALELTRLVFLLRACALLHVVSESVFVQLLFGRNASL